MQELVTCPVCTLYLRPGMALEDHLETHPKEQVIRALVSLAVGSERIPPQRFQPQDVAATTADFSGNNCTIRGGYSQQPQGTQFIFAPPPPPPPRPNVMIVNRQSTMVYHSATGVEDKMEAPTQRIVAQPNFIAPSQLQIFTLPHNPTTSSKLPPPPAYGTAINQLRSQQNQSNSGFHIQPPHTSPSPSSRNSPHRPPSNNTPTTSALNFVQLACTSPRPPPSPSVLRYAESPVSAQYVERENGDFIVQESPRHVVECIETESGEFSVIEKVIQSPPSVVQFQDCDKDNDNDSEEYFTTDAHSELKEDTPSTLLPDVSITDDGEAANEPVPYKGSGMKDVTVLSNVKLDPNESLEIMENLENMKSSAEGELIWTGLADIKKEVGNIVANTGNKSEKAQSVSVQSFPQPSTSTTTSVIRLASNNRSTCQKEEEEKAESLGTPKKDPRPATNMKRPYRKQPKKLTVKFKVAIPGIEANSTEENMNCSVTGASSTTASEMETQVQSPNLVIGLDNVKVNKLENDENSTKMQITNEVRRLQEPEMCSVSPLDASDNAIDITNSNLMDLKQEVDNNAAVSTLEKAQPMIVHEPSLSGEAMVESSLGYKQSENLQIQSETEMLAHGPNLKFEEMNEGDYQGMALSQMLDQVCGSRADKTDSFPCVLSAENNSKPDSSNIIEKMISTTTNELNAENVVSNIESPELNAAYLTLSLSTKPSTSILAVQEEQVEDEKESKEQRSPEQHQTSEANTDYPFGLIYGSTNDTEEQTWSRYITHQQMSQFPELDNEQSNYMDLDTYKITSCQVSKVPNIHTDEKMPAKGEISEQESNGDVDNSWSNPHYSIPEFRITSSYEHYKNCEWTDNTDGVMPFSQEFVTEIKADPLEKSTESTTITNKSILPSIEPSAPILTTTSTIKVEEISECTRRQKQFQCAHCTERFPLLKERNAHLIEKHGYKRVNRRLVREAPSCTVTTGNVTVVPITTEVQPVVDNNITMSNTSAVDTVDDLKPDIKPEISVTSTPIDATVFPRTKYDAIRAGVYRMLMHFNLNVLKDKKVEVDEAYFESKSFCCFTCRRSFISVKLYDEHLAEHPAECFTCGRKFSRWTYFSLHLKRHLGWKDFACTVCEKKFVIRSALVEHMRIHTGIAPLKCNVCDKTFKRYSNLTQHKKVCHSSRVTKKKDYVCYCGEVLPSKARFLWHKETHETKPKVCPYCRDRFIHRRSLKRHIRLTHSDKFDYIQPVKCKECKQVYAKASMKAHMLTHSIDTLHECSICNKSFTTKWNLKIHSWVHANRAAKPFKCEHCIKAFVREVDYKNHINSHKNIKPFTCEFCGCKFIRKYNYMRHRREHTAQKRFKCDLCCKMFHRNYYLIEHRRMHTGERPFLCTICGKSSTTKTNHNKHLKIHHSRDPFTSEA